MVDLEVWKRVPRVCDPPRDRARDRTTVNRESCVGELGVAGGRRGRTWPNLKVKGDA